ncbi:MAG: cytochrome c oxidase assembly protein [Rhodomicrobium sp.]|nr:cytochrome c oxidase assembly protein [Rhodomicrobium sp.]
MTQFGPNPTAQHAQNANRRLAAGLALFAAVMVGLSFAAVPLYRIFCQVTGYGGTTQKADAPSARVVDRVITVRFDASVSSDLKWSFRPVEREVQVKIGENKLAFYEAANKTGAPLSGTASFNVTPEIAGSYFSKIECFCFVEQTLQPGQRVDMPVSFFIDPAILDDPDARRIEEIVLSYTFFKSDKPGRAANAPAAGKTKPRAFENDGKSG